MNQLNSYAQLSTLPQKKKKEVKTRGWWGWVMSARHIVHSIVWVAADLNFNKTIILLPSYFAFLFLFLFQRSHSHSHSQPERERERDCYKQLHAITQREREREMKITALLVLKCNPEGTDPVILANALDVSHFGYFQRSSVKEFILFVARTVASRTPPSQRQSVQHEGPRSLLFISSSIRFFSSNWNSLMISDLLACAEIGFQQYLSISNFYYTKHTHTRDLVLLKLNYVNVLMLCVLESSMHNLSSFVFRDFETLHSLLVFCIVNDHFLCFLYLIEYKVHAYNRNGICSLGFMDDHYPVRSAFSLLNQVHTI